MRLFIITLIVFVPSVAFALETPAESLSSWTGWSYETLFNVLLAVTLLGPLVGNGLAIVLTKLGYLEAAAWVARKTPLAIKLATRALEAPTKGQAIAAIVEVAKEAHDAAPISVAAELLKKEPPLENDRPILEAVK